MHGVPLGNGSTRVVDCGGAAGHLRVEEPFWSENPEARGSGTGATLWNGSVQLARYLSASVGRGDLKPERVVELGAGGCGVPSLAAARLGFREVIATDGGSDDVEDNLIDLSRNAAANAREGSGCLVRIERLRWGEDVSALGPPFGCVLAAEVVYEAACVRPLLQSLHSLSSETSMVLLYHTERNAEASAAFWRALPHFFRAELLQLPSPPDGALAVDDGVAAQQQQQQQQEEEEEKKEAGAAMTCHSEKKATRTMYGDGLFRLHRLGHTR